MSAVSAVSAVFAVIVRRNRHTHPGGLGEVASSRTLAARRRMKLNDKLGGVPEMANLGMLPEELL